MLKTEYDPLVDAGYIHLSHNKVINTEEISQGIILDYDSDSQIVGIEVLNVHRQTAINVDKLPDSIRDAIWELIHQVNQEQLVKV